MIIDQNGNQLPGRNAAFSDGLTGTPNMVASGLAKDSAVFNSKVPGTFTPHSVLQGIPGMSPNGMSATDAQRKLPGGLMLPSPNGIGKSSYDAVAQMRLFGRHIL